MDARQFDTVVKALGNGTTRRRLLRSLGGALGVGVLGTTTTRDAAAATWCKCDYFCPSHGTIRQCHRASCPAERRYKGERCQNSSSLCLVYASKGACTA